MTSTATKTTSSTASIDDQGLVSAVFCTLDLVDLDGDVILPGAITPGPVAISAWSHGSWQPGMPPVGTGTIKVVGGKGIFVGRFLLDSTIGRDTWLAVKALFEAGIGEWSWSLRDIKGRGDRVDGRPVRLIESVRVHEVSPVLAGASLGTRTISAKDESILATARRHVDAHERDEAMVLLEAAVHAEVAS